MGALTHDTWGITPAVFLTLYGVAFLVTLVASELRRRRILRDATPDPVPNIRELDPCEHALVIHGEDNTRADALLNLEPASVSSRSRTPPRAPSPAVPDEDAAASKADARRLRKEWTEYMQSEAELAPRATTIAATGSRPRAESCRLEVGLAEFVATRNESMLEAIATDPGVEDFRARALSRLVDRGYLLDDGTLGRLRWLRIVWLPLLALGVVRLATKVSEGRPVGFLVLALLVTVAFVFGRTLPDAPPLVQAQVKHAATARSRDDVEHTFARHVAPFVRRHHRLGATGRRAPAGGPRPRTPSPSPSPTQASWCAGRWWACGGCGGCGCGGCGCA